MTKFWTLRAFKALEAPCFQNLESKINSRYLIFASEFIVLKISPAITFQNFETKFLAKIHQLAFKFLKGNRWLIFDSNLLSKFWKQIVGKNSQATFQIFERLSLANFRKLFESYF